MSELPIREKTTPVEKTEAIMKQSVYTTKSLNYFDVLQVPNKEVQKKFNLSRMFRSSDIFSDTGVTFDF